MNLNALFREIFNTDLALIEGPEPEIQAEIDANNRLRSASLRRVGDKHTENSEHWHGIAPAGALNKGAEA